MDLYAVRCSDLVTVWVSDFTVARRLYFNTVEELEDLNADEEIDIADAYVELRHLDLETFLHEEFEKGIDLEDQLIDSAKTMREINWTFDVEEGYHMRIEEVMLPDERRMV
ncbi:gp19 [Listeria seeligeri FSL S4-171]|uniref:hypothetical protein n=1 Tax=Listeria seeligeri TaxID=1640 RepID=UPI0001EB7C08|nr:hypothetical protein [Listeria seeligeri]EBI2485763.1 hypothetical protein [Listeria monocytogenes]EFS02314.1 gp19 [Listeria seeligeri FSL S4-171]